VGAELLVQAGWRRETQSLSAPRPTNYARSLFHFASAAVGLTTVALLPAHPGVILAIALTFATYAWSMEIGRRVSPRMNAWLMRLYAPVAHPHEANHVNSATWYATALVFLALFASRPATMAGLAVLGVADPLAGIVGRRWGTHTLRAGRSLEGSLTFVVVGAAVAAIALAFTDGLSPGRLACFAVLSGVTGAFAELFSTRLDDNLTIPVAVGSAVTLAASLV
jgi:dolichol kinase